ncbi:MAG TPA: M4 family metallopeptidase [Vicinamibacteria bacterium]|nr:M4 family metallopeptidase [Vicinamibacteria bacterium]
MTFRHRIAALLAFSFFLGLSQLAAQSSRAGNRPRRGFRALTGQQAADFRVPSDMRRVSVERSGRNGQYLAERYRQFLGAAEVLGGQLTIYRDETDLSVVVVGAHYPDLSSSNTIRIGSDRAEAIAASRADARGIARSSRLMIDPRTERYFYRVELRAFDARWFYWVDAETGTVVNAYDGLTTGDSTGIGVLGDTKDLTDLTTFSAGSYRLVSADGRQSTYDAGNRNRLPGSLATDADDSWNTHGSTSPGQPALVDAQFNANVTDDYYLSTHGFDWLNHYSQGMVSSAHVQRRYNNAYWNGSQMAYGDGDGSSFIEFSGDLDVVGHELSHGVTEATSDLIYQNESGALNEAFSDIMGTAIEYYHRSGNWTIGEDVTLGTNGIRNMADPGEDGDPSHYADRYTGTGDNGGVHINSGIANHWFYLLVNGGQNAEPSRASGASVQGIGFAVAEDIAFRGFTALPSTADFCDARESTAAVAGDHAANVMDAWDEVGVDDTLCSGDPAGSETPVISNAFSKKLKGTKFEITWMTNVPANSEVTFTCCGSYTSTVLVTSHSMAFNGSRGYLYEYYISSTDADGNKATKGPLYHQN